MNDETLFEFIDRRHRELESQLVALTGEANRVQRLIENKKEELAAIQRIRESTRQETGERPRLPGKLRVIPLGPNNQTQGVARQPVTRLRTIDALPADIAQRYAEMTIKGCVVQAIVDKFPEGGTAAEIRDFIRDAYSRTIQPSSLRPQMNRLKAGGILTHNPLTDTWNLVPEKRTLYLMYDHTSSRKAMKELKDDPELEPGE
jgi:hypothetical protein